MFAKSYLVKVYLEGQAEPLITFTIKAAYIAVEGHTLHADSLRLHFAKNQYITTELA